MLYVFVLLGVVQESMLGYRVLSQHIPDTPDIEYEIQMLVPVVRPVLRWAHCCQCCGKTLGACYQQEHPSKGQTGGGAQ